MDSLKGYLRCLGEYDMFGPIGLGLIADGKSIGLANDHVTSVFRNPYLKVKMQVKFPECCSHNNHQSITYLLPYILTEIRHIYSRNILRGPS